MTQSKRYTDWGLVYFAWGEDFVREAECAVATARAHMPDLPAVLFANSPALPGTLFDEVRPTAPDLPMKQQKMYALLNSPFGKTLFLDTDTFVANPLYEVLELVEDGYDMAAALSPWYAPGGRGYDGKLHAYNVPIAFPKINSGVMALARNKAVDAFLHDWQDLHAAWGGTGQDQDPLRVALYRSQLRWAPLPPNYNYRTIFPAIVNGPIKVLHGRHPEMAGIAAWLNQFAGMRGSYPTRSLEPVLALGKRTAHASPLDLLIGTLRHWFRRISLRLHR